MKLMSRGFFVAAALLLLGAAEVLSRTELQPIDPAADRSFATTTNPRVDAEPRVWISQSSYSTQCVTSKGSCRLERPQRVGSNCKCGDVRGRVVR